MVTFLRPHPQAHGPAAVNVRLRIRSKLQPSSSLVPCGCSSLSLSPPMAQDPSQTKDQDTADTNPAQQQPEQQELITRQEPASTSSSSSGGGDTGSWLQLGVGQSAPGSPSPSSSSARARRAPKRPRTDYEAGPSTPAGPPPPPLLPELGLSLFPGSSSSSLPAAAAPVVAAAPPPAHEAGTWFVLQAAQNQRREPPLPQIPRSYLRVRDGRMTVRVVMSYLVNKLGLEDDSQLEITCRGQRLLPAMTLQHVRDTIWRPPPAEAAAVLPAPGSSSTNQVMTLHYGRS